MNAQQGPVTILGDQSMLVNTSEKNPFSYVTYILIAGG